MSKEIEKCQKCNQGCVAEVSTSVHDFTFTWPGGKVHVGKVLPHHLIGLRADDVDHDHIRFRLCLVCGQVQGTFPVAGSKGYLEKIAPRIYQVTAMSEDKKWTVVLIKALDVDAVRLHIGTDPSFAGTVHTRITPLDAKEVPPSAEILDIVPDVPWFKSLT